MGFNGIYPLVMTNIAMENSQFIDGLPGFTYLKWWFSMAMLNNQMVDRHENMGIENMGITDWWTYRG